MHEYKKYAYQHKIPYVDITEKWFMEKMELLILNIQKMVFTLLPKDI